MKSPNLSHETLDVLDDRWRLTPARMAEHLAHGRFQRYHHIQFLDRKLAQAIAKGGARLVISMPPRHGKSWLTSLYTPAWYLSMWPNRNVILTSYEASFAASWGRQVRNFLNEHQSSLGIHLAEDSQAADRWNTVQGGAMVSVGAGGAITGRGGNLILVDDILKNWEEASSETIRQKHIDWFNSTLYTRAEPGASIVILMTRWHERDLAGYLLNEHQDSWEEVRLPALAEDNDPLGRNLGGALCPQRYDEDALNRIKQAVGTQMFNALYQQRPAPAEGNIIKRSWWKYYQTVPSDLHGHCIAVDLTFGASTTSDYTVMTVWGLKGADRYMLDMVRARMTFTEQITALQNLCQKWPMATAKYVEDAANGKALIDTLRSKIGGLIAVKPDGSKEARAQSVSPLIESGNVYLPLPSNAIWVQDVIEEWAVFPSGKNDDIVDSMVIALRRTAQAHCYDIHIPILTCERYFP